MSGKQDDGSRVEPLIPPPSSQEDSPAFKKKRNPLNPQAIESPAAEFEPERHPKPTKSVTYPPIVTIDGRVDTDIDHLMDDLNEQNEQGESHESTKQYPKPHVFSVIDGSIDDDIDSLINDDGSMEHTLVDAPKNFDKKCLKDVHDKEMDKKLPTPAKGSGKGATHSNRSYNKQSHEDEYVNDATENSLSHMEEVLQEGKVVVKCAEQRAVVELKEAEGVQPPAKVDSDKEISQSLHTTLQSESTMQEKLESLDLSGNLKANNVGPEMQTASADTEVDSSSQKDILSSQDVSALQAKEHSAEIATNEAPFCPDDYVINEEQDLAKKRRKKNGTRVDENNDFDAAMYISSDDKRKNSFNESKDSKDHSVRGSAKDTTVRSPHFENQHYQKQQSLSSKDATSRSPHFENQPYQKKQSLSARDTIARSPQFENQYIQKQQSLPARDTSARSPQFENQHYQKQQSLQARDTSALSPQMEKRHYQKQQSFPARDTTARSPQMEKRHYQKQQSLQARDTSALSPQVENQHYQKQLCLSARDTMARSQQFENQHFQKQQSLPVACSKNNHRASGSVSTKGGEVAEHISSTSLASTDTIQDRDILSRYAELGRNMQDMLNKKIMDFDRRSQNDDAHLKGSDQTDSEVHDSLKAAMKVAKQSMSAALKVAEAVTQAYDASKTSTGRQSQESQERSSDNYEASQRSGGERGACKKNEEFTERASKRSGVSERRQTSKHLQQPSRYSENVAKEQYRSRRDIDPHEKPPKNAKRRDEYDYVSRTEERYGSIDGYGPRRHTEKRGEPNMMEIGYTKQQYTHREIPVYAVQDFEFSKGRPPMEEYRIGNKSPKANRRLSDKEKAFTGQDFEYSKERPPMDEYMRDGKKSPKANRRTLDKEKAFTGQDFEYYNRRPPMDEYMRDGNKSPKPNRRTVNKEKTHGVYEEDTGFNTRERKRSPRTNRRTSDKEKSHEVYEEDAGYNMRAGKRSPRANRRRLDKERAFELYEEEEGYMIRKYPDRRDYLEDDDSSGSYDKPRPRSYSRGHDAREGAYRNRRPRPRSYNTECYAYHADVKHSRRKDSTKENYMEDSTNRTKYMEDSTNKKRYMEESTNQEPKLKLPTERWELPKVKSTKDEHFDKVAKYLNIQDQLPSPEAKLPHEDLAAQRSEYIRCKVVGSPVDPSVIDSDFASIEFNDNATDVKWLRRRYVYGMDSSILPERSLSMSAAETCSCSSCFQSTRQCYPKTKIFDTVSFQKSDSPAKPVQIHENETADVVLEGARANVTTTETKSSVLEKRVRTVRFENVPETDSESSLPYSSDHSLSLSLNNNNCNAVFTECTFFDLCFLFENFNNSSSSCRKDLNLELEKSDIERSRKTKMIKNSANKIRDSSASYAIQCVWNANCIDNVNTNTNRVMTLPEDEGEDDKKDLEDNEQKENGEVNVNGVNPEETQENEEEKENEQDEKEVKNEEEQAIETKETKRKSVSTKDSAKSDEEEIPFIPPIHILDRRQRLVNKLKTRPEPIPFMQVFRNAHQSVGSQQKQKDSYHVPTQVKVHSPWAIKRAKELEVANRQFCDAVASARRKGKVDTGLRNLALQNQAPLSVYYIQKVNEQVRIQEANRKMFERLVTHVKPHYSRLKQLKEYDTLKFGRDGHNKKQQEQYDDIVENGAKALRCNILAREQARALVEFCRCKGDKDCQSRYHRIKSTRSPKK